MELMPHRAFVPRAPEQPKKSEDPREMSPQRAQEIEPLFDLPSDRERARIYKIYFENLVNGVYSLETLPQRFKAVASFKFTDGIFLVTKAAAPGATTASAIRDKDGKPIPGEAFPISDVPSQTVLFELATMLENPAVKQYLPNMQQMMAKPGQESALQTLTQLIQRQGDPALAKQIEEVVGRVWNLQRVEAFATTFGKTVFEDKDLDKARAQLGTFAQDKTDDVVAAQKFRSYIGAERRRQTIEQVQKGAGTAEDQLKAVAGIVAGGAADDRELAVALTVIVYNKEITDLTAQFYALAEKTKDKAQLERFLNTFPVRPTVGGVDYIEVIEKLKEKLSLFDTELGFAARIKRLESANAIRSLFTTGSVDRILESLQALPEESLEEIAVKLQLVEQYKASLVVSDRSQFERVFAKRIATELEAELRDKFKRPDLGRNRAAFEFVRERFVESLYPLIEILRDDPKTKEAMAAYMPGEEQAKVQRIQRLAYEQQRPLTDIERAYLDSVELLSFYNNYLVGAASCAEGVTDEFLRHHFDRRSAATIESLEDGSYVPLIQIGLGPNGLAAIGEVVRNNPQLADGMLVVDAGEQPGGPFAIPRGPAWELNSANRRGTGRKQLPSFPNGSELKTVRAYGSPLRWYPGERSTQSKDVRQGSINTTVDFLPTPDDLSSSRYPTNEELQRILSLQAAVLVKNVALKTRVLKVEKNPNVHEPGDKIATLQITQGDGSVRVVKVKTDALFIAAGLGEPTYGFEIPGSRAQRVMDETQDKKGFKKLSTTLEAFRALSDRRETKQSPGETLVIYGGGNSADTLIEFIGSVFQGENPRVRDVTKIYIVSEADLSARPRYAQISDLKPRNGRGNLIELVRARVADVGFENSAEKDPMKRRAMIFDSKGQPIKDNEGDVITGDSVIAATGFRPMLDNVLSPIINGSRFRRGDNDDLVAPITLPTNPDVSVADVLVADPSIVFLGTASRPRFQNNAAKLGQLPPEAREALNRNGAENAVAIGFRAPDTQAAVNIWLNQQQVQVEPVKRKNKRNKVSLTGVLKKGESVSVTLRPTDASVGVPDHVESDTLLLSTLISYEIGNKIEDIKSFVGRFDFLITIADNSLDIEFEDTTGTGISPELFRTVENAFRDPDVQEYVVETLGKRRRNKTLTFTLAFRSGKVDPINTVVE